MKFLPFLFCMALGAYGQVSYFSQTLLRQGTPELWRFYLGVLGTNTSTGITNLNGLSSQSQTLAVGTGGVDFNISSAGTVHQWNLPTADATHRGALSAADWAAFNSKVSQSYVDSASNALRSDITALQEVTNSFNTRASNLEGITNALDSAAFSAATAFQPADADLTNWANLPTNAFPTIATVNAVSNRVTTLEGMTNAFLTTNKVGTAAFSNATDFATSANLNSASNVLRGDITTLQTRTSNLEGVTNALGSAAFQPSTAFQPADPELTNWANLPTNAFPTIASVNDVSNRVTNLEGVTNALGTTAFKNGIGVNDLTNSVATTPADGDLLAWNDGMKKWTNVVAIAPAGGTPPWTNVDGRVYIISNPSAAFTTNSFVFTNTQPSGFTNSGVVIIDSAETLHSSSKLLIANNNETNVFNVGATGITQTKDGYTGGIISNETRLVSAGGLALGTSTLGTNVSFLASHGARAAALVNNATNITIFASEGADAIAVVESSRNITVRAKTGSQVFGNALLTTNLTIEGAIGSFVGINGVLSSNANALSHNSSVLSAYLESARNPFLRASKSSILAVDMTGSTESFGISSNSSLVVGLAWGSGERMHGSWASTALGRDVSGEATNTFTFGQHYSNNVPNSFALGLNGATKLRVDLNTGPPASSILITDGGNNVSNLTIGANLSFDGQTLSASGGDVTTAQLNAASNALRADITTLQDTTNSFLNSNDVGSAAYTDSTAYQPANAVLTNLTGARPVTNITFTTITATGISLYTTPTGCTRIEVIGIGGGAGGGGVDGAASQSASGGGGGSGAIFWTNIVNPASSYVVTIGTNGPGGAAGNNAGSVGGQTLFTNLCTAPGGLGGSGDASAAAAGGAIGGAGAAVATGGIRNSGGTSGANGICPLATLALSGAGGSSPYGGGGAGQTAAVGGNATGFGAGGGGAAAITNADRAGGNGSPGAIFITEYYQ